MKPSTPVSPATKFARYATASAAALGAAAAADAQFTGSYTLTPPSGNTYGAWTATIVHDSYATNGTTTVDISQAGLNQLTLSAMSPTYGAPVFEQITFLATALTDLNVSFSELIAITAPSGTSASAYYTANGASYTLISSFSHSGTIPTFLVSSGNLFGFRITATYTSNLSAQASSVSFTISNLVTTTAIPEPGTSGVLVGCAALGFIGLMAIRESRRRSAAS